ncbi:MAG: LON peptidase substrate-binding domain-containing protein [Acidimicrobiia bacterium]|nr:LON peptidase substrate-binding domain-containing protein [Acidimicrobiia bacterium]
MEPTSYELAMFPLGTVLVPRAVLPLHLFEPRYLTLAEDVLATEPPEFGVVLIERGAEVGGGDVRTSVGTVASVARSDRLAADRLAVVAVGVRRVRVVEWLADDPYPRASVEDWPDDDLDTDLSSVTEAHRDVVTLLRQALAAAAELGAPSAPATIEISTDPRTGSFEVAAVAPIGPTDRHAVLAASGAGERVTVLHSVITEVLQLMRGRLAMG